MQGPFFGYPRGFAPRTPRRLRSLVASPTRSAGGSLAALARACYNRAHAPATQLIEHRPSNRGSGSTRCLDFRNHSANPQTLARVALSAGCDPSAVSVLVVTVR